MSKLFKSFFGLLVVFVFMWVSLASVIGFQLVWDGSLSPFNVSLFARGIGFFLFSLLFFLGVHSALKVYELF